MELRSVISRVDELKSQIDALHPIDAEQEARVMQMFRLERRMPSGMGSCRKFT